MLEETKVAVVNGLRKVAALVINRPVHITESAEERQPLRNVSDLSKYASNANVESFESNDLDSMLAWFKSYGVDRPLILEPTPAPVAVQQNSSRAA
jgi:hypothetical protein